MNLTLKIWRQASPKAQGQFETVEAKNISPDSSFLEMLDIVNEEKETKGQEGVAFDHDCREGICGSCSLMINGVAHGPQKAVTTCQLHMRSFKDGDTVVIEPWRARAFPIVKDLVVDRSAFDRIVQSGGYVSVSTGSAPEANSTLIAKDIADKAFEAAACIGCGACVASCKNASAMLFVSAKLTHLNSVPQGQPEKTQRTLQMVSQMDQEGFGGCTNTGDCEAVCPKEIKMTNITEMNKSFRSSLLK